MVMERKDGVLSITVPKQRVSEIERERGREQILPFTFYLPPPRRAPPPQRNVNVHPDASFCDGTPSVISCRLVPLLVDWKENQHQHVFKVDLPGSEEELEFIEVPGAF
ncbi:uncharacterized protein LOC109728219 [Ananas comosus]|uniref:Uncharacterized protein LOC109728219 n=1 Tax=Ananas comosus TaxID=4615 RepID=A0A6P5H267_ANACO|nr:uncharacterized protein LOC109728219 [Ananas comosus]